MSAEPVADLARARAAFEQWRTQRPGRGRLPDHLWALALSLVPRYSIQSVARELRLNSSRLRARLQRQPPRPTRREPKPAFVELRAAQLVPARQSTPDTRLQPAGARDLISARIQRPDGATLTLTLPAVRESLDQLCAAFLRA